MLQGILQLIFGLAQFGKFALLLPHSAMVTKSRKPSPSRHFYDLLLLFELSY